MGMRTVIICFHVWTLRIGVDPVDNPDPPPPSTRATLQFATLNVLNYSR